ncbi:MAG: response regulator transcription factor [Dehalococcoidia bacterium]|nr:response regulator transcription factor [Dehalococcoidia bacterium]MDZ4246862.1 response regulator transcription factor [Dehalococcoidia bacterium]
MIKILVADDHPIVRQGLTKILAETNDIVVSGEAGDGQTTLQMVSSNDYDVVLLDISMPGGGGLEILNKLKTIKPHLSVLVLSMHPEEQYAVRALQLGASGYLTKGSAPDELIAAIRRVSEGRKYLSPVLAEKLAFDIGVHHRSAPHEALSNREFQIMCLIASGKTVRDISNDLCLSVKTVSTYRSRVLQKMDISNNALLTSYAIRNNLV